MFLIYDRDLEGEHGTFDRMRLRAYDDATNYTLDLGVTDNNPLGVSAVGELAVGRRPDRLEMIKDEEVLRQNESFELEVASATALQASRKGVAVSKRV